MRYLARLGFVNSSHFFFQSKKVFVPFILSKKKIIRPLFSWKRWTLSKIEKKRRQHMEVFASYNYAKRKKKWDNSPQYVKPDRTLAIQSMCALERPACWQPQTFWKVVNVPNAKSSFCFNVSLFTHYSLSGRWHIQKMRRKF